MVLNKTYVNAIHKIKNMKKKFLKYRFGLLLFMLIAPALSFAQNNQRHEKRVFINGSIDNAIKVLVRKYSKYYLSDFSSMCFTDSNPEIADHIFHTILYDIDAPTYVSIYYYTKNKIITTELGTYLVEPGDSINVKSTENGVSFYGGSASRFKCQHEMKLLSDTTKIKANKYENETIYGLIAGKLLFYDSLFEKKMAVLNAYKSHLSKKMYAILYADCLYEKSFVGAKFSRDLIQFKGRNISKRKEVIQFYNDHYLKQKNSTKNIQYLIYSKNYTDFLYWKTRLDSWIKINQCDSVIKLATNEMYWEIVTKYEGLEKEKLLLIFLSHQMAFADGASLFAKETIPRIKDPVLYSLMEEIQRKTKGTPAYNFSLKDSSGSIFHLSDFSGKTVVLDFWYTGCRWCPIMANMIKPIAQEKDTGIVFITVSIDKNMDIWKQSLQEGKYSSGDELNLYTEGRGLEHGLIKYYRINTFPSVLIIDPKGRISSINPVPNSNLPADVKKLRQAIIVAGQNKK